MKNKILFGIMALVMSVFVTGCSDDDYAINTRPLLTDDSVETGSADVTATSATLHGSVSGLDGQSASAYVTGFYYGPAADALTGRATATGSAEDFTATVSGSVGETIYYQAYVTLQGTVTYSGEVKSTVLTNARATTGDATGIGSNKATLAGTLADFPAEAESGIIVSGVEGTEKVRAGVRIAAPTAGSYTVNVEGLVPNTTYYYVAYLDLGAGMVYGDVKSFTTTSHVFDLDNDLVDLGLSTKWAKYNVGASSETEVGGLYGFGDLTGFNTSLDPADYASGDIYKTERDIANQAFESKVTMPTIAEFEELFSLCQKEWTEVNGVSGYRLTGPNGNSIFLPAAGSRTEGSISGEGVEGYYLSGSINASDNRFAMSYHFNSTLDRRTTTAVYQAAAIRPVSTAKNVPFNKELLYGKWYLDNGQDGKQHVFEGPFTQWGVTDNWNTISNGQPNIEQSIHWEMGTGNGWIGYTYGVDYGYMEFMEDGTVNIHRLADDGTATDETGHFTIDEANKVIDIDINVLCANTWIGTKSGKLNILTLTSDGLQIALPADETYAYSLNYYSQRKADADAQLAVSLLCVGSDWSGTWGTTVDNISPEELAGQHSFKYEGSCNAAMVVTLDFPLLASKYPNAFVRIDEIKCDGNAIKFDANNFYYGEIEDNNYRVELFNIYGVESNGNGNKVPRSPFSAQQNVESDPAFQFSNSLEITYTVIPDADIAKAYTPKLITINPSWGGPWDYNQGATMEVKYENYRYTLVNPSFDIKYEPADVDHSAGSIMTFIEVSDIYRYFPGLTATLDNLLLDGEEVTFDAAKVLNSVDSDVNYRLELWNCYGITNNVGCAFGTPDGEVIKELGFRNSMELKFTFNELFAVPEW